MAARKRTKAPPVWSGPERWECGPVGPAGCWLEILPFNDQSRELRNDLDDRWFESIPEVEDRRRRMFREGSMVIPLGAPEKGSKSRRNVSLADDILAEAEMLVRGKRTQPVPITLLRSRVHRIHPHHRTDFDEAALDLFHRRKVVLSRNDNTPSLSDDDREDAVWVGDQPRHLLYLA